MENSSKIFNFVKHWADRKEHEDAEQFLLFLTGDAGTGKSHTIRCSYNKIDRTTTRKSENAESAVVLLVAYTGTAAYNIGGQTIHLAFNVNHCKQLPEESANTLRSRLHELQLLIIDEVSMVSADLLNLIHCRLQQVKKHQHLKVSLVMFLYWLLEISSKFHLYVVGLSSLSTTLSLIYGVYFQSGI